MIETLRLDSLIFEVRRSPRRKTFGLTVDRGGELVIHAPERTEITQLSDWTRSKLLWVHRKLLKKASVDPRRRNPEFVSGESFSYLGKSYRLKIVRDGCESLCFDGRSFRLNVAARSDALDHFRSWYIRNGRDWLGDRKELISRRIGVVASRVSVRDLGYRWGSCGKGGSLYFNWKLLQLPVRLIDYVIAQELAHLLIPKHGAEFGRILDRSLPDWRERSEELKLKAREIYWCNS